MAAAVADFRPKQYSADKINKKTSEKLTLEMEQTVDILESSIADLKQPGQITIGFAAESSDLSPVRRKSKA